MDKTTFDLDAEDCAIIFKKDMSSELVLPEIKEDETVDFNENQNVFVAMAISASLNDPAFREIVGKRLDEMFAQVEASTEEVPPCDPSGCPGGCCGGE